MCIDSLTLTYTRMYVCVCVCVCVCVNVQSNAGKAMEGSAGMPVGVQVVTRAWQDEQCLKIMKDLEEVVQFNRFEKGNMPNL